jgi:uncharacterized protein YukE
MAKAVIDPAEVRRFAHDLKRFSGELQTRLMALHGRFQTLGDTWEDQEHEKFAKEFDLTLKTLSKFVERSDEHTLHLLRKAERAEAYLAQR